MMKISIKYFLTVLALLVGLGQWATLVAAPTAKAFVDKATSILNKAADTFDDLMVTNAQDVFKKILIPLVKSMDDLNIEVRASGIKPVGSGVSFTGLVAAYKKLFLEFNKEVRLQKAEMSHAYLNPTDLKTALGYLAEVRTDVDAIIKALVTSRPKEVVDVLQYALDFNASFEKGSTAVSANTLVQNFAKAIDQATDKLDDVTTTNAEHVKKILKDLNAAILKVDTSAGASGLKPGTVDMSVVFKAITAFEKGLLEETKATESKALSRVTYLDAANIGLVKDLLRAFHTTLTSFVKKLVSGTQYKPLLDELNTFIVGFKAVPTGAQAKPFVEKIEKAFAEVFGGLPIVNGKRLIERIKDLNTTLIKINESATKVLTTPGPLPQPFTLFEKLDVMLETLNKKTTPFPTNSPTIFVLDEAVLLPLAKDELTKALNAVIAFCKKAFVRSDMIAERVAHVKEFIATLKQQELAKKIADDEAAARAAAEKEALESGSGADSEYLEDAAYSDSDSDGGWDMVDEFSVDSAPEEENSYFSEEEVPADDSGGW